MHIVLLNLPWPGKVSQKTFKLHLSFPPLDLLIMRRLIEEAGHTAEVYDGLVTGRLPDASFFAQADWVIAATTPYHMWQCPNSDWDWIRQQIQVLPVNKTVLSGIHGAVFPEKTLAETGVCAVLGSEPETTLQGFLTTGKWQKPVGPPLEMDQLCSDYRDIDIKKYQYPLLGRDTFLFESSRGCPWKCTFCCQEMFQNKYRWKTPARFVEEVAVALSPYSKASAYFFDLEFTVSKKRTSEICRELQARKLEQKLKWCCQTRADTIDKELLLEMKAAGCRLVHFGVESAHEPALQLTNKKITLEQIEHGVQLAKSVGLSTACFFMFGLPGETSSDFKKTLAFSKKLNPTFASYHFAIPFPGTPLYQQYLSETGQSAGIWPSYFYREWSHAEVNAFIRSAYREFYLKPKLSDGAEILRRAKFSTEAIKLFCSVALR